MEPAGNDVWDMHSAGIAALSPYICTEIVKLCSDGLTIPRIS